MNRRLMMAQQNKGFELVYNSASGTLPTDQGWDFAFWAYGNDRVGGTQSLGDNLLKVKVEHTYENCYYYPNHRETAKNCEFSVTVNNLEETYNGAVNMKVGFLLSDGEKAIELVFRALYGGKLQLTNDANDLWGVYKWTTDLGAQTNFTLRARLESGVVSVWFNDELLTILGDLYTTEEIVTQIKKGGSYGSINGSFNLFPYVKNTIAFGNYGRYYVSQLTYKEW